MLTIVELVILALASFRATRLVVHDVIADPVRDAVFRWLTQPVQSRVRDMGMTLLSCIYCAGWWVSGLLLAVYLTAAHRWTDANILIHGLEWFAVAGGAALLNRADDTLAEASA
ncbi:DUF1360 domain-containing protein [Nonomuraea turcica]|uniref:DUF1360 domain-containing protein n=1 Tax=Nonomuraea sp. G32 TaxID=3067274 RepID=UPI00273B6558|nr:DUF1360 domain-containing protein [Nonomuraea sp. G32]MDP4501052.1 DUF1360 domain-containing protein [Nonomuraea sp. G32]